MNKVTIAFGIAVLTLALLGFVEASQAQTTPIYNNTTPTVDNSSWIQGNENVTIDSFGTMLTRIGTFVIGDTESGDGPLFTGLLVAGLIIGITGTSRVGMVAGGMLGVLTAAALTAEQGIGIGPPWLYGTIVMVLGLITAVVYIRMVR